MTTDTSSTEVWIKSVELEWQKAVASNIGANVWPAVYDGTRHAYCMWEFYIIWTQDIWLVSCRKSCRVTRPKNKLHRHTHFLNIFWFRSVSALRYPWKWNVLKKTISWKKIYLPKKFNIFVWFSNCKPKKPHCILSKIFVDNIKY